MKPIRLLALCVCLLPAAAAADGLDEFKVKRADVFEFAEQPAVTRDGDRTTIAFASKAACDVTIAIEDADGRILRHLVSGVLGDNAPPPLQPGTLRQRVVWDGKDDAGRYVKDPERLTVRVSLGLRARFERTLYWHPAKRVSAEAAMAASPAGVLIFDGRGLDHLRQFDHAGDYVRTVYPYPRGQLNNVNGIPWHDFPQGFRVPLKHGFTKSTLLTSGDDANTFDKGTMGGSAASAVAVHGDNVALVKLKLNRLTTAGATPPGLTLEGPEVGFSFDRRGGRKDPALATPRSAAFSPDGKWLYLTGYAWHNSDSRDWEWLHAVYRLPWAGEGKMEVFVGKGERGEQSAGDGPDRFKVASSLDVDAAGRVYVSDYMNDRIQVFTPDGKLARSIKVAKPAWVQVNRKTGDIHVFSWMLVNRFIRDGNTRIKPVYTHLGPVDDPKVKLTCTMPLVGHTEDRSWNANGGVQHIPMLDSWAEVPTIWLVPGAGDWRNSGNGSYEEGWARAGLQMLVEKDGKLQIVREFGKEIVDAIYRPKPAPNYRQRLYVNPTEPDRLYVGEDMGSGVEKSFKELLQIEVSTGKIRPINLPFDCEDMCFDTNGWAYLRTDHEIARFDPRSWAEIPWDYGEERDSVGFSSSRGGARARLRSALETPGHRQGCFHMGGMAISPTGLLVVECTSKDKPLELTGEKSAYKETGGRKYTPKLYPGRVRWGEIHVWNRFGELVHEDAVPGMGETFGLGIDRDGDIYVLATQRRMLGDKPYFDVTSSTLVKVRPGKAKLISTAGHAPIPLTREGRPSRAPDLAGWQTGAAWIENAEWFYGGIGFAGFNPSYAGGGCSCWNARFTLDLFARSVAPETAMCSVAVLDSNGNLILRVGQYGNVDDGRPLIAAGGPPTTREIGGDEVGLFYPPFVGTFTDRRLYISDPGNGRLLAVKLDYHAEARLPLKDAK